MTAIAPGELDPACAALIRSHIANDRWTVDRIFVAASDAGVDWPMFADHIANMAGRMLVSALGGHAQAAELAEAFANAVVVVQAGSDSAFELGLRLRCVSLWFSLLYERPRAGLSRRL
jgi:hypothetical protein